VNLGGGFNHSEKYLSNRIIIPNIWRNKIHVPKHQPVKIVNDCKRSIHIHTSHGNRHLLAPCCAAGVQGGNHGIHPIPIHRADRVMTRTSRVTTGREEFEIRWETQETSIKLFWLVVYLPLWKMMEFVSWDDYIFPTEWKIIKTMFQTTNQILYMAKSWFAELKNGGPFHSYRTVYQPDRNFGVPPAVYPTGMAQWPPSPLTHFSTLHDLDAGWGWVTG
jgi:hypothetical protein